MNEFIEMQPEELDLIDPKVPFDIVDFSLERCTIRRLFSWLCRQMMIVLLHWLGL